MAQVAKFFHPRSVVLTVSGKEVKGYAPDDMYFRHEAMTEREILMEMHNGLAKNKEIAFSSLGVHLAQAWLYGGTPHYFCDYNVEIAGRSYENRQVLSFSDAKIYKDVNGRMVMSFVVNASTLMELSEFLLMELDYSDYELFRYLSDLPRDEQLRFRFVFYREIKQQMSLARITISNGIFKFSYYRFGPVCEDLAVLNMLRHLSSRTLDKVSVYEVSKEGSEGEEKIALVVSKHTYITKTIMRSKNLQSLMLEDQWSPDEVLMADMVGKKNEIWLDKDYARPLLSLADSSFEILDYLPITRF